MLDKHIKTSATGLLEFLPICCPCGGCLDERDHSDGTVDGSLICESCGASHPVSGGVPDFIHPKMLLDMPVDLFGAWHVTQINGEERYEVNDPASLSLETRDDVIQVKQLLGMQGLDVLDVGSGSNAVPGYIEEDRVRSFVALDPLSPSGRPPMNLVRAMAEYLPFEDESFDLVLFMTSYDHVLDGFRAMREAFRVLRPGGRVVIWWDGSNGVIPPKLELTLSDFDPPTRVDSVGAQGRLEAIEELRRKVEAVEANRGDFSGLAVDSYHLRHPGIEETRDEALAAGFRERGTVNIFNAPYGPTLLTTFFRPAVDTDTDTKADDGSVIGLRVTVSRLELEIDQIRRQLAGVVAQLELSSFRRVGSWVKGCARSARRRARRIFCREQIEVVKAILRPRKRTEPNGRRILMLTTSMMEIDPRINKVADALVPEGFEIEILCPHLSTSTGPVGRELVAPGVTYNRVDKDSVPRWQKFLFHKLGLQYPFLRAARDAKFDFVHANDLTVLPTAWVIARNSGVPLVYDAHEMWSENCTYKKGRYVSMPWLQRRIARWAEGVLLKRVDEFFSVSPSINKEYLRRYGREPKLLANVPDTDSLSAGRSWASESIRSQCGIGGQEFVTLYLGGLGPARNIEAVIQAHGELPADHHFVICGPGSDVYRDPYLELARGVGAEGRVHVLPPVGRAELLNVMDGADCGIVMLRNICRNFYWFYPNKFFEYSLGRLPVAVSNFPDVSAHIERENSGVVFDPDDPSSISAALRSLAEDRQEARRMGRRGYDSIQSRYNWNLAMRTMVDSYRRMAAGGDPRSP
jgi:glycosyltransferase involved in cell wall biosynthesis/SAM-dependent methyltransferase